MGLNLPQVIGHRGAALAAPENTLESFREAAAQGAKWVEFDVGLSADGQCFVLHDDTLDRTTSGKGPAHRKTIACLTELDLMANVEIKGAPEGRHAELAKAVMAELRKFWPAAKPKPLISSFELECLRTAHAEAPEFPRGYLIWGREVDWLAKARSVAAATINIDGDHATREWMAELKQAGYGVLGWTVNAPERAARLIEWGADGVFTDAPGAVLARLGKGV